MKQVLYRAYRPNNFDEIYGQDHIISILKNQIKNNSISHAYLFCGPRGTGKTSTARIFAKELNGGSELDIIELDAASHNKVEDMREIIDKLKLAPFEAKYKIYILDEVHMLSQAAFNAFLKSLEEPPQHVIFILATTEPNKLPQTILSRTQRFDFNKISNEQIRKRLEEVLHSENITYSDDAIVQIVNRSDGGLRDALGLLDKVISYGEITAENVNLALGVFSGTIHTKLFEAIIQNNTLLAIESLEEIDENGIDPKVFVNDFISNLKDAILIKNKVDTENEIAKELAQMSSDSTIAFIIEELGKTLNTLRFSPNAKVELIAGIVSLCNVKFENIAIYKNIPANFQKIISEQNSLIRGLEAKISKLEQKLQQMASYPQNFVENPLNNVDNLKNISDLDKNFGENLSTEQKGNEFSPANVEQMEDIPNTVKNAYNNELIVKMNELMPEIKQRLRQKHKMSLYSVFEMAIPYRMENDAITFVFEGESRKMIDIINKSNTEEFLDPIISELFGKNVKALFITDFEIRRDTTDEVDEIKNKLAITFPEAEIIIKE